MLTILTVLPLKSLDALTVVTTNCVRTVAGVLARIVNAFIYIYIIIEK